MELCVGEKQENKKSSNNNRKIRTNFYFVFRPTATTPNEPISAPILETSTTPTLAKPIVPILPANSSFIIPNNNNTNGGNLSSSAPLPNT